MNLIPFAQRLHDLKIGTLEKTIFINMIPISANNGILLRNPLVGTKINYEMKGYLNTEFQVIVRASNYKIGEDLMKRVFDALTLDNTSVHGYRVTLCYPTFEPVVYPLSDGNLLEFSTDFHIVCHEE